MTSCARLLGPGAVKPYQSILIRIRSPPRSSSGICSLSPRRSEIVLRLPARKHFQGTVSAAVGGGAWERSQETVAETENVVPCVYAVGDFDRTMAESGRRKAVEVAAAAAMTVVLGVGNRVLYKLALVPLKRYPFFLAQLATFG